MFNELVALMVSSIVGVVRFDHDINPHIPSKITAEILIEMFDILGEAVDGYSGAEWKFNNCVGWGGSDGTAWSASVELNNGTSLNFSHGGSQHDITDIWIEDEKGETRCNIYA